MAVPIETGGLVLGPGPVAIHGDRMRLSSPVTAPVPAELYLREVLPLDVEDPDEVAGFMRRFGFLYFDPFVLFQVSGYPAYASVKAPLEALFRQAREWETNRGRADYSSEDPAEHFRAFPVSMVQGFARICQAVVRHYVAAADGADPSPAWAFLAPALNAETSWAVWAALMSHLMVPFHPRLDVPVSEFYREAWAQRPDLGSIVAAQVFNAVVEHAEVRTCPLCGSRFSKQEGRAAHGQNRTTSVTYCSSSCARAKANRDYRARERAKKDGAR